MASTSLYEFVDGRCCVLQNFCLCSRRNVVRGEVSRREERQGVWYGSRRRARASEEEEKRPQAVHDRVAFLP